MDQAMEEHVTTQPLPVDRGLPVDDAKGTVFDFSGKHKLLQRRLRPLRDLDMHFVGSRAGNFTRLGFALTRNLRETAEILYRCGSDIKELWTDDVVQRVLKNTRTQLEYSSGL